MLISMFGVLVALLVIGVPIAISVGGAVLVSLLVFDPRTPILVVPQRMFTALDTFPFLAVPFFILAGNLMERGGISKRLIMFAMSVFGKLPATMACITTISSAFFGAISGSNPATVAAIGGITVPEMKRRGYPADHAAAIAASSGTLGVVIPPSIPMVTYSVVASVSTGAMFVAGFVPGVLLAVSLLLTNIFICRKFEKGTGGGVLGELGESAGPGEGALKRAMNAIWALMMPIIILGGIYSGVFTPTEASAVSCLYAAIVSLFVYREMKLSDMYDICKRSALATALVMFVCCLSAPFSWVMTSAGLPGLIATTALETVSSKILILLMMNLILLFLGCFLETQAIILLITPILLPLAVNLGIHPIALGIIIVVNTSLGMITPPMAVNLFVAGEISGVDIITVSRRIIPYLAAETVILLAMTYWPDLIMWLPRTLNFV